MHFIIQKQAEVLYLPGVYRQKQFIILHDNMIMLRDLIVDGSSYCLLLKDEIHSNNTKPWSSPSEVSVINFSGMPVLI